MIVAGDWIVTALGPGSAGTAGGGDARPHAADSAAVPARKIARTGKAVATVDRIGLSSDTAHTPRPDNI